MKNNQRILKFRVWDTKKLEYFFPNDRTLFSLFNDERFVIQPFTGLLDKNGKEIYEGDIIQKNMVNNPPGIKLTVSYSENKARYIFNDLYGYDYNFYSDYYEVIGNIFENTELLKK